MKPATVVALSFAFLIGTGAVASAHSFRIEGKELKTGESHNVAEGRRGGTFVLLGKPFLVAMHIECTKIHHASGQILGEGKSTGKDEFEVCSVSKPANCFVSEPIVVEFKGVLIENAGSIQQLITPKIGETFTTVTLTGASCALKEAFSVGGSQTCTLPGMSIEQITHETECSVSGSKLKAGGSAATYEGRTSGHLEGEPLWSGV